MMFFLNFLLISTTLRGALALPSLLTRDASITSLSTTDISALVPFFHFAAAAYCPPAQTKDWSCDPCKAVPTFKPTLEGGDGSSVLFYYVGFDKDHNAVIVGHQGTDPLKLKNDLTDINLLKGPLDSKLFPGVPSTVWVHTGFKDAHAKTAGQILPEVKRLLSAQNTNNVITVGHSLGGAVSELEALFLQLNLPGSKVSAVTMGTPRVGNAAFVNFFQSKVPDFKRINNKHDLVPIVPGRFLGFQHPQGEIHILGNNDAVSCAGIESEAGQCQIKTVPTILQGSIPDHLGPYQGVSIGGCVL